MQNSEILNEQIEAYLNDALSATDRKAFEQNMATDSSLREEVSFQQDIIEGLKRERRAMLKARLSSVELPPLEAADLAATTTLAYWAKWIGGAALLGGVILAAYYWSADEPVSSGAANAQTAVVIEQPTLKQEAVAPQSQETAVTDADQIHHSSPQMPAQKATVSVHKAKQQSNAPITKNTKSAQVSAPVLDGNDSDNSFEKTDNGANVPTGNIANESVKASPRPEVVIEKSQELSYKYYNNKLYLYGDFNNTPYELLELNSTNGRNMYIYFGAKFYELKESQSTAALSAVKDADLINNLNVLRKKRAE